MHKPAPAKLDAAGEHERQAGRIARDLDARFRATFEQSAVGLTHTDFDGRFLHVNRRFCRLLGYDKAEVLAMPPGALTHPEDRGRQGAGKAQLLAGEFESVSREKRYVHKDGRAVWVRSTLSLARDAQGQPDYFVGVIEDISERKQLEAYYHATVMQAPIGIWHTGIDKRTLHVNHKLCDMLGYSEDELLRLHSKDIVLSDHYGADTAQFIRLNAGEIDTFASERPLRRKDGHVIWVNRTVSLVRDSAGVPLYHVRVMIDITEQKRAAQALAESEQKFRQLAENVPEIFWITDAEQREMLYLSPAFEKITGRTGTQLLLNPSAWLRMVHVNDRRRVSEARKALPEAEYNIEYRIMRADGKVRWLHDQAFPVFDEEHRAYRIVGIAADITQRKAAEEKLLHIAHYDALTGLPSRALFNDRLKQHMARARRNQKSAAVLMLGLDRFKLANETLGHAVGDELLKQVAQRLTDCLRKVDTVARLSGDEFAIVLDDVPDNSYVRTVAQKILDTLAQPFCISGYELFVTASIGISLCPSDGVDEHTLTKTAGAAQVRAKDAGRNNFQFYTAEMNTRTLQRLEMENGLRRAVERQEFLLHYQPKVDLRSGAITGFEALLRWQRPAANASKPALVSPADFIPLLEETGLIVPVGEWIIDAACAQIATWRRAGIEPRPIAINLSGRQFTDKNLANTIKRALETHMVESYLLELEITESSLMNNTEDAIATLNYLKSLGLHISIDDFGTGYSSLSYLKRFPLDALKVDRSFVRDITTDSDDAAITLAIISMAHSLGLKVIAEGVETEAQLAFLAAHGCEQMQGYYFSKPVPAADCGVMLSEGRRLKLATAA